ncbi:hypothetical protein [Pedobacter heparinus]|uniref:hypothetical protein n=1 Tax=Pedobacter heparinus TaxID=984 RepID=UPI00292CD702|nr:hypothetical protein [Pedobacter heparinus]
MHNYYIYVAFCLSIKSDGPKSMKLLLFTLLICSTAFAELTAQTAAINGAWQLNEGDKTHNLLLTDGFYFHTIYQGKQLIMTQGGSYEIKGNKLACSSLFNSADSTKVGTLTDIPFSLTAGQLRLDVPEGRVNFKRIDEGKAPLAGVWRITGRMGDDGKINAIHQTGTRQTYKMLTGTKFQWVAIDPAKKQFSGTGGGSYIFKDGKYTENIEFFSRDNSRVGASLVFDGKLENGDWHHSGLSSKGAKIYEVWSKTAM